MGNAIIFAVIRGACTRSCRSTTLTSSTSSTARPSPSTTPCSNKGVYVFSGCDFCGFMWVCLILCVLFLFCFCGCYICVFYVCACNLQLVMTYATVVQTNVKIVISIYSTEFIYDLCLHIRLILLFLARFGDDHDMELSCEGCTLTTDACICQTIVDSFR